MVRRHKRWHFYKDYTIEELNIFSASKKIGTEFEVRHDGTGAVFKKLTEAKAYVRLVIKSEQAITKKVGL